MIETLLDIDAVVAHSYKDFHAKGVDYLCLRRSPELTLKIYLFDGDASKAPEVVYPHDHRYEFHTTVLAGAVENVLYLATPLIEGEPVVNEFSYLTPLNGGSGFHFKQQRRLVAKVRTLYPVGAAYGQYWHEIHTIRIAENDTILFLRQYADDVPVGVPSRTFSRGDAPSFDGLYSRFTADEVITRLRRIERPLLAWMFAGGRFGGTL